MLKNANGVCGDGAGGTLACLEMEHKFASVDSLIAPGCDQKLDSQAQKLTMIMHQDHGSLISTLTLTHTLTHFIRIFESLQCRLFPSKSSFPMVFSRNHFLMKL